MNDQEALDKVLKITRILKEWGMKYVPSFGRSYAEEIFNKTENDIRNNPELRKRLIEVIKD